MKKSLLCLILVTCMLTGWAEPQVVAIKTKQEPTLTPETVISEEIHDTAEEERSAASFMLTDTAFVSLGMSLDEVRKIANQNGLEFFFVEISEGEVFMDEDGNRYAYIEKVHCRFSAEDKLTALTNSHDEGVLTGRGLGIYDSMREMLNIYGPYTSDLIMDGGYEELLCSYESEDGFLQVKIGGETEKLSPHSFVRSIRFTQEKDALPFGDDEAVLLDRFVYVPYGEKEAEVRIGDSTDLVKDRNYSMSVEFHSKTDGAYGVYVEGDKVAEATVDDEGHITQIGSDKAGARLPRGIILGKSDMEDVIELYGTAYVRQNGLEVYEYAYIEYCMAYTKITLWFDETGVVKECKVEAIR